MLEAYNGGGPIWEQPGSDGKEDRNTGTGRGYQRGRRKNVSVGNGKYLATTFLLSSYRRRYGELILSLQNDYAKQQKNYPKTRTDMYGLMVAFEPTRAPAVSGGQNKGINFGNIVA